MEKRMKGILKNKIFQKFPSYKNRKRERKHYGELSDEDPAA
jgi:hypothetical protein